MSQGLETQGPERTNNRNNECCKCICRITCRAFKTLLGWIFESKTITAIFTVVAAIGTAVSAYYVRETLTQTQRAWLSPSRIQVESALVPEKAGVIAISYANVGKEPATNVGMLVKPFMLSNNEINDTAALGEAITRAMDGISCRNRSSNPNGFVVYPSNEGGYKASVDVSSGDVTRFLARDGYLVVAGCITYETFGETHFSEFCRYFEHRDNVPYSEWKSGICKIVERAS